MTPKITFDEATHTYYVDGVKVPSVSEIIAPLRDFSGIDPEVLRKAQDRGKAVHKACELHDLGTLGDLGPDAAVIEPYLKAWLKFSGSDWEWISIEEIKYHSKLVYCGTADRIGIYRGEHVCGVDIKATAKSHAATGVQLGAYELLWGEPFHKRIGVRLKRDGTFEATEYPDETVTFRSLLNVWKWKQRNPA